MKIHQNKPLLDDNTTKPVTYFDDVAAKVWPWVNSAVWVVPAERTGRVTVITSGGYEVILPGDLPLKLWVTRDQLRTPDHAWRRC
ncbi:MAG: hypothetical protein FD176_2880 [Rhodospirillaceae bacterium]|nr:MAG: hypothetical protein FD176_2880 [Rhodospirillaceae bacterium]TNC93772.1 MAG: hypothetical protein FD119_3756 [Stygiobacter sp.]